MPDFTEAVSKYGFDGEKKSIWVETAPLLNKTAENSSKCYSEFEKQ